MNSRDSYSGSSEYVQSALRKQGAGAQLTSNEQRRLARLALLAPNLPVSVPKRPSALNRFVPSYALEEAAKTGADGAPGSNAEGAAVNVVGSDGKLNVAQKHSTWAAPTTYPTALKTETGIVDVTLDSNGVAIEVVSASPTAPVFSFDNGSETIQILADSKIVADNGTNSLTIDPAAIIQNITADADGVKIANAGYELTAKVDGVLLEVVSLAPSTPVFQFTNGSVDFSILADGKIIADNASDSLTIDIDAMAQTITVDADGVKVANSAYEATLGPTGVLLEVLSLSAATPVFKIDVGTSTIHVQADGKIVIDNGANTLTVDPSDITADMTIREIDVCDGGTAKQMLIIGSAPY